VDLDVPRVYKGSEIDTRKDGPNIDVLDRIEVLCHRHGLTRLIRRRFLGSVALSAGDEIALHSGEA